MSVDITKETSHFIQNKLRIKENEDVIKSPIIFCGLKYL